MAVNFLNHFVDQVTAQSIIDTITDADHFSAMTKLGGFTPARTIYTIETMEKLNKIAEEQTRWR